MSVLKTVKSAIKKYGSKLLIEVNGEKKESYGFIQPLRYKNNMYLSGSRLPAGYFDGGHYLMICQPDVDLSDYVNTVIHCLNKRYIIKRSEQYTVMNKILYNWAILTPYGQAQEDDYGYN